ncbi:hypothetical protein HMPREF0004_5466 [Achromobacter piechaudii ATCC 43553]|uniref:Uncharacterized protein n=2 Tax=Achromobacter piechaudii TaxID=72556 RepID=D4XJ19_9BURK|nr:hypothetical protein HMPREF0004_5466 [Achromobacter piechaudii ATCC 43553]
MHRFLCTPDSDASFDFFSNTIQLERLKDKDKVRLEQWLRDRSLFRQGGQPAIDASNDKADLVHEATHFMDATTTLWGLEYNYRKSRVLEKLQKGESPDEAVKVFMLNCAELEAHTSMTQQLDVACLAECVMKHKLVQHDTYGPMVMIEFQDEGKTVQTVPLSMLSILEANGYANETLSRIIDAEHLTDPDERTVALAIATSNYSRTMNDAERSEYTLLLHLINRACDDVPLKERLILVSKLIRAVLDLNALDLSKLANRLAPSFLNRSAGEALTWELRRGTSRPVVVFKAILAMDGFLTEAKAKGCREQYLQQFVSDPASIFELAVDEKVDVIDPVASSIERKVYMDRLEQDWGTLDHWIIPASVAVNRTALLHKTCAEAFDELVYPDYFLNAENLQMPMRIDCDVREKMDARLAIFGNLNKCYREAEKSKFYMRF